MRRLSIATAIALFVVIVGLERTTAGQGGGACDRQCLTGIAEQYSGAVIAKTPDKAGLATHVRMTENGQDLQIGEALWSAASGRGVAPSSRRGAVNSATALSHDTGCPAASRSP